MRQLVACFAVPDYQHMALIDDLMGKQSETKILYLFFYINKTLATKILHLVNMKTITFRLWK